MSKLKQQLLDEINTVLDELAAQGMLFDDGYGTDPTDAFLKHPFNSDAHGDAISQYAPLLNAVLLGGDDEREYTKKQGDAAAELYWKAFSAYIKENGISPDDSEDEDEYDHPMRKLIKTASGKPGKNALKKASDSVIKLWKDWEYDKTYANPKTLLRIRQDLNLKWMNITKAYARDYGVTFDDLYNYMDKQGLTPSRSNKAKQ